MILFLDFDGVLHPAVNHEAALLLCNRPLLEDVLRRCPSVEIVVSSTWRKTRALDELRSLFSADIAPRIVGLTPQWREIQDPATYGTYVRQAEVESWLRSSERQWEQWMAVDDQAHLFRPFCKNLFVTNATTGLTEFDCEVLVQRIIAAG